MTNRTTTGHPRRLGRSILSDIPGFYDGRGPSLGIDEVFHLLRVYPPWNQPMNDPGLNLLALSYRIIYTVLGSSSPPGSPRLADAPRLGARSDRICHRNSRRDRDDSAASRPILESDPYRRDRLALRLARRQTARPIKRKSFR